MYNITFFIVLNFLLLVKDKSLFLIDILMYNILEKKLWQIYNIAGNYVLLH